MSDLTLLLATANLLPDDAARRIRDNLLDVMGGRYPVISVSQRPMAFGRNICVGEIGANKYNEYRQIYIGACAVETEYVAVVDDDVLYTPSHFDGRPAAGVFRYETNYWFAEDGKDHYWRLADRQQRGGGMWGCVAQADTLRDNLEARFRRFPTSPLNDPTTPRIFFGEPGVRDGDRLYNRRDTCERVSSPTPCLIFVHSKSMGFNQLRRWHRRYGHPAPQDIAYSLETWGTVADVRRKYWSPE